MSRTLATPDAELLTVPEVMSMLKVGRHKVYDLIRSRQLRSVKVGNSRRIPAGEVSAYVNRLLAEES